MNDCVYFDSHASRSRAIYDISLVFKHRFVVKKIVKSSSTEMFKIDRSFMQISSIIKDFFIYFSSTSLKPTNL
jgi:hypothetical protein